MGGVLPLLVSVLSFAVLLCYASRQPDSNDNLNIYGGDKISIKQAPFMAGLLITRNNNRTFFCGGSIVSDRFILTAAHCLRNVRSVLPLSVEGFVGSDNMFDPHRTVIKPEQKICNSNYDSRDDSNDICLIKLKDPLKFGRKVARVILPFENFDLADGTMVDVTGWGLTENNRNIQTALRQVAVPVSDKYCRGKRPTVICTGSEGRSTCIGDSGGPVTYGRVQVGVISGGLNPTCGKIGSYHTKVTSYLKWINSTIYNHLH